MIDYANMRFPPVRDDRRTLAARFLWFLLWSFVATVFLLMIGGGIVAGLSPMFGMLGPALALLLLVVAWRMLHRVRRRRAQAVLGYLEQAMRLHLPLPRMLRAAQDEERGATARRLWHLRDSLEQGVPMSLAINAAIPELPARTAALATAAERAGTLQPVLQELVRQERAERSADPVSEGFFIVYPLVLVGSVIAYASLVAIYVLPKYEEIMSDFGIAMPPILAWSYGSLETWGALLLPLVVIIAILLGGHATGQLVMPLRDDATFLLRARDRVLWSLPLSRALLRDRGLADACRVIADFLEAGQPAHVAIAEAAELHVARPLQVRLRAWREGVLDGMTMDQAARQARLPALLVSMLQTAQAGSNAVTVFRFLARYYRTRFSRTAMLLRGAFVPAVALVMGIIVAVMAVAMFLPLVMMIDRLIELIEVPL
jgi:type II secretory pathway component PulF